MNLKEIKDAARKAFSDQQSQDTEGGVPDAVSFIAGFIEGSRHRQEENEKLKSLIKDLVNNGMDSDIARRIEELEIGE